jgi:hypothetical protein
MTEERSESRAYEMITPPNKLKAKVGGGKGIDPAAIARAREVVASMAGDFEARAVAEIDQILKLLEKPKMAAAADPDGSGDAVVGHDHLIQIFRIGHELKGQGGTFGYPLITKIGASLCNYIDSVPDDRPVDIEIVRAHALALKVVASNRITGEGGAVEKEVISGLDRLLKRKASA